MELVITGACSLPPTLLGRLYPLASTPTGHWLPLSETNGLPRSPPVFCQSWLLSLGCPSLQCLRWIYHITRSPSSWFEVWPSAADLSPSPIERHRLLEHKPVLMSLKNTHRCQLFKWPSDMPSEVELISRWSPAVTTALCLTDTVITEPRSMSSSHIWPDNSNCD